MLNPQTRIIDNHTIAERYWEFVGKGLFRGYWGSKEEERAYWESPCGQLWLKILEEVVGVDVWRKLRGHMEDLTADIDTGNGNGFAKMRPRPGCFCSSQLHLEG